MGRSSNGKTPGCGPGNPGSTPGLPSRGCDECYGQGEVVQHAQQDRESGQYDVDYVACPDCFA